MCELFFDLYEARQRRKLWAWESRKTNTLRRHMYSVYFILLRQHTSSHITCHRYVRPPTIDERSRISCPIFVSDFVETPGWNMSLSSVLMAPVRGIVWVVKLPFVLVWTLFRYIGSCIYGAVAAILRWANPSRNREPLRIVNQCLKQKYQGVAVYKYACNIVWNFRQDVSFVPFQCTSLLPRPCAKQAQVDVGMGKGLGYEVQAIPAFYLRLQWVACMAVVLSCV